MAKTVSFKARKKVSVPVKVAFKTKTGKVAFPAHKTVKKSVRVKFRTKG